MFQAGVSRPFMARHFLRGDFDQESVPHSHEYIVEWRVATSSLDENGFSVDIALMEDLLEKITSGIADRLLNDLEFFKERQASVENTALYLHQELSRALEEHGVDVDAFQEMEIKIWESDVAWASYRSR